MQYHQLASHNARGLQTEPGAATVRAIEPCAEGMDLAEPGATLDTGDRYNFTGEEEEEEDNNEEGEFTATTAPRPQQSRPQQSRNPCRAIGLHQSVPRNPCHP
jgi:hypothetical protein